MDFMTQDVREVALSYMEGLDSSQSLGVAMMLRYGDWDSICELTTDPNAYSDPRDYLRNAAASNFLKKLDVDTGVDLEPATFDKWLWAEKECFKTNVRLNRFLDAEASFGEQNEPWLTDFVRDVRKNVIELIGHCPPPVVEGKFGPGATVSDSSRETTVCHKMSSVPTFTQDALFHLVPWTGTKWAAAFAANNPGSLHPKCVRGNEYFTAPKTSLIRRPCGKEPSINAFYQLGYGRIMRKRLKGRGIDLDNGQAVHRRVACESSMAYGLRGLATLDETSASDCKCIALVKLALPHAWYNVLSSLRSPFTKINGRWWKLEKFSSMGNGFTFELETVIFAAITMAVCKTGILGHDIFVYGDDIICPSEEAENVTAALKYFGFTVNPTKSFIAGNFRESCGGDFFNGVAVRPFQLKELFSEPQQVISAANGIRRLAHQNSHDHHLWHDLRSAWFRLLDLLPSDIRRCRGPNGLGDVVIHDSEERWDARWRSSGIRWFRCYRPAMYRGVGFDRFSPEVQLSAALYGVSLRQLKRVRNPSQDERSLIPRDGVTGYKVGWVPFS